MDLNELSSNVGNAASEVHKELKKEDILENTPVGEGAYPLPRARRGG